MSGVTAIEWCDSTFNPWIGCTKVSPACDDCYAARSTPARTLGVNWGPLEQRRRTSADLWKHPGRWNSKRFMQCGQCGWRGERAAAIIGCGRCGSVDLDDSRRRVFCASLADWLDNEVPTEWLVDLLDLVRKTPDLDWLQLSKRIGNWRPRLAIAAGTAAANVIRWPGLAEWICDWLDGKAPRNVWLGITVVNQAEVDRDVPKLLATPAAARFLSVEPMLGQLEVLPWLRSSCWYGSRPGPGGRGGVMCPDCSGAGHQCRQLHWVICGGESGPKARPIHPDWARSLRDQCAAAGVPFLFKQWGEWAEAHGDLPTTLVYMDTHTGKALARECDGFISLAGEFVRRMDDATTDEPYRGLQRIGKKKAGRQLDGRTHDEWPEVRA